MTERAELLQMTALGQFISDQIEKQGVTAKVMAERMGIAASVLSNMVNGKRTSVNLATFCRMAAAISEKPSVQAAFFLAALHDYKNGKLSKQLSD